MALKNFFARWGRIKTYGLEEVDVTGHGGGASLAKVLTTFDLTLLGVGSTLGVGIYVLAGSVAKYTAGPAVCISFLVAAVASAFAALCYAEFGARVPKAGSAYVYSYVTVGEFIAFVIGWNLILEYLIGTASVARAFSANLDALTNNTMSTAFIEYLPINSEYLSPYADMFCLAITLVLAVLLGFGVQASAYFTNVFTFVNIGVVLFVIIAGSINADTNNWYLPAGDGTGSGGFMPYGFSGVMAGAAKCFFAFVGFDSIAATSEEAKDPKRAIPISINLTLIFVFIAYFGVSVVLTLMCPYYEQDPDTPLIFAFDRIGWHWAAITISIGSLFGLAASLLGAMIPLPRIIYAKAKDGLVFRFLAYIHPRFQTPVIATAISGAMAAILGAIFDLESLVDMMSIGTLLAYTLVAVSVLILRYEAEPVQDATDNFVGDVGRYPWQKRATSQTSRKAVFAIVAFCMLAIVLCSCIRVLEMVDKSNYQWIFFGIGCTLGPMILLLGYLTILPKSQKQLYFQVPGVPLIPCLSVIINTYLMTQLSKDTWLRFAVWMAIGFIIYFAYGMWNSSEEYVSKGKPVPGDQNHAPTLYASDNLALDLEEDNVDKLKLANEESVSSSVTLDDQDRLVLEAELIASAIDTCHVRLVALFDEDIRDKLSHQRDLQLFVASILKRCVQLDTELAKIMDIPDQSDYQSAPPMDALFKELKQRMESSKIATQDGNVPLTIDTTTKHFKSLDMSPAANKSANNLLDELRFTFQRVLSHTGPGLDEKVDPYDDVVIRPSQLAKHVASPK